MGAVDLSCCRIGFRRFPGMDGYSISLESLVFLCLQLGRLAKYLASPETATK